MVNGIHFYLFIQVLYEKKKKASLFELLNILFQMYLTITLV